MRTVIQTAGSSTISYPINEKRVVLRKIADFFRRHHLTPSQVLVVGFALVILIGAWLLTLPISSASGRGLNFIDALFTATSAVCVTGLVVVDTGTYFSLFGQVVIISLIQIGGLGFMTMATLIALLIRKRIGLRERLLMQEALNQLTIEGVVRLTRYIILVTVLIETTGALILALYWASELGWHKALYFGFFHAISAFCNAGFDLFGGFRSLTAYVDDLTVNLVITSLIILGGIGFTVLADIYRHRRFNRFSLHTKTVLTMTALLIIVGTIVIYGLEYTNPATLAPLSAKGKILGAYFQAVTPRTAGYNTLPIGEMRDATLFFTVILMFIGASPGSTGGGIKTATFGTLLATVWAMVGGKEDPELFKKRLPREIVYKALSVTMISLTLVVVVTMILSITERASFLRVLYEVTSAFGTVGLSTGITPGLTTIGKLLITFTMFAGRVGPLTIAVALGKRERKVLIRYPEDKIIVG